MKKYADQIKNLQDEKEQLEWDEVWFEAFVEYVNKNHINLYNEAFSYAEEEWEKFTPNERHRQIV